MSTLRNQSTCSRSLPNFITSISIKHTKQTFWKQIPGTPWDIQMLIC